MSSSYSSHKPHDSTASTNSSSSFSATAPDAGRSIFSTRLLGTPPPPTSSSSSSCSPTSAPFKSCPYPSPLSPELMTLPPISPQNSYVQASPQPPHQQQQQQQQPQLRLKPISELGFQPPTAAKRAAPDEWTHPHHPAPHRRAVSCTHLPSPAPTVLARLEGDVYASDGEEGQERHVGGGGGATPASRPLLSLSMSSPTISSTTRRVVSGTSSSSAVSAAPAPDIGRRWWDTVIATASPSGSPLRPAIRIDGEDQEVDQLTEEDGGSPVVDERPKTATGAEQSPMVPYPASPLRRLLAAQEILPRSARAGTASTPSSPYAYGRSLALPPGVAVPSPTPSSVSLPAAFSHHQQHQHAAPPSPPDVGSPSLSSSPHSRRSKPNYLNRPNVPLYNRSKLPPVTDGELSNATIFRCNYVPPRSTDPSANQPTTHACETTSLKKADMLRHMDEIHAKDESERVFRGELDLEVASRYLADLAEMVVKETKAEPNGSVEVPLDASWASSSGGGVTVIPNLTLRAQADCVRHNLRHEGEARFDFVGRRCEQFRAVAMMRLGSHRVWQCKAKGCGKVFGTQRSMERHRGNKHGLHAGSSNAPSSEDNGSSEPILVSRGTKRGGSPMDSPRVGAIRHYIPASPHASPIVNTSSPLATSERPLKRMRVEGPRQSENHPPRTTPLMRVRQQTPEMRLASPMIVGGGLQMVLGERSTLTPSIKMEEDHDQLADDILELAEGR